MIFKIICKNCGKKFESLRKIAKFCSHKCYAKSLIGKLYAKKGKIKKCRVCGKEFYVYHSTQHQKFCSPICYFKSKKGIVPWNKGRKMPESFMKKLLERPQHFKKGHVPHNKGKTHSEETRRKISENRKGKCLGEDNPAKRKENRERNKLRMKKVWADPIERKRYSKGWFLKGDIRFKTNPVFIEGIKKGRWIKSDKRLINNTWGFKKGLAPHNKLTIPPKDELKRLYEKEFLDSREIAEIYRTNGNTILNWLKHYGIKKRKSLYGYNNKIICKAGHKVDSIGERQIADFFFENGIDYLHNKTLTENKKITKRYDFYLPDVDLYIEFKGLKGKDWYDKNFSEKLKIYEEYKLQLLQIEPKDNIKEKLKHLIPLCAKKQATLF